jgi:hypothetical protein
MRTRMVSMAGALFDYANPLLLDKSMIISIMCAGGDYHAD